MTNQQIILMESVKLMEDGILSGSGVIVETPEGKKLELPEDIHTYAHWKSLGYQVKRGEKAIAQFPIWKYTSKKKDETEEETQENGHCFMKMSSFFKTSQVEVLK